MIAAILFLADVGFWVVVGMLGMAGLMIAAALGGALVLLLVAVFAAAWSGVGSVWLWLGRQAGRSARR